MKEWKKPAGLRWTISSSLNFLFLKSASRGLAEKGCCNSAMSRSAKFLSLAQEKKMKKCVWWIYLRKVYLFILYLKIVVYTCIFEWYEFQSVFSYHYPVFSAKILVCLDVFSRNGSQSIRLFSSMRLKISSEICCGSPGIFVNIVAYISCSKIKYILYSQIDSSPEFLSRFFLEHHFLQ